MRRIEDVERYLERLAPGQLAEAWDNVGLLVGDPSRPVRRVMSCLTVTPATAAEAVQGRADLIVTHHPMPFQPVKRLTSRTTVGRVLLQLIRAGICVYSPHTAFDSAVRGVNQWLAEGLGLEAIEPLVPAECGGGGGRWGRLSPPSTVGELAERTKRLLNVERVLLVGSLAQPVTAVAVACGAAGQFLEHAHRAGCDAMLVGETRFHTCLEAEALGIGLVMPGHFASERFAVERLAELLRREFPDLEVWAARTERDPIHWV